MFKVRPRLCDVCPLLLCFLLFISCKSQPSSSGGSSGSSASSSSDAQSAAQAALNRMDGGGGSLPSAPASSSSQQGGSAAPVRTGSKPAWVDSADSVFNRALYVAAVGYAADRAMAERNALANLTAVFGQSIKADQKITNTYQEAVRNGVTSNWSDNTAMENNIKISASLDTLVGAEIKEIWQDTRNNTYYAAAVMEKAIAVKLYTDMIKANQDMIKNLLNMTAAEKNSFEGLSRYYFAAAVADINISYGNLLRAIDASTPQGLVKGDEYRLEAQNITRAIPVGIIVKNDKSGRIQGAFAKSLSGLGFRSGGNNSRYVLQVDITVSPVDLPNNPNKFARIELGANLTDTSLGSVLLPFNFNTREGHASMPEAENRVFMAAERKINAEYKDILSDYLSSLLPERGAAFNLKSGSIHFRFFFVK